MRVESRLLRPKANWTAAVLCSFRYSHYRGWFTAASSEVRNLTPRVPKRQRTGAAQKLRQFALFQRLFPEIRHEPLLFGFAPRTPKACTLVREDG